MKRKQNAADTAAATVNRRGKQHDIRAATLVRLADDMLDRAAELVRDKEFATERILTLKDLAEIFRKAAKRERKLR